MGQNKVLGVHKIVTEHGGKTKWEVRKWVNRLYKQVGVYATYKEACEATKEFTYVK